jgi:hypothetical protein
VVAAPDDGRADGDPDPDAQIEERRLAAQRERGLERLPRVVEPCSRRLSGVSRAGYRKPRRRERWWLRWALAIALVAAAFAVGVALGEALHDNPRPHLTVTSTKTIVP